jgi:hypothetical protein
MGPAILILHMPASVIMAAEFAIDQRAVDPHAAGE